MKQSYDWMVLYGDGVVSVNDYILRFTYGLGDLDLGLWKGLWISGERVGFCFGIGCGKDLGIGECRFGLKYGEFGR